VATGRVQKSGNKPVDKHTEERTLIANADDLGYTRGINRAIAQCHRTGIITSATLMAGGTAFDDALTQTRDLTGLGIGVHLVLTELRPVARPGDLPGLVDQRGFLPSSPAVLLKGVLQGTISASTLQWELDHQVAKILDHGIIPTHLDSHKHVHVFPQILAAVIAVARRYGIRWIRNPFDGTTVSQLWAAFPEHQLALLAKQALKARLVRLFRLSFHRRLQHANLRCADHFFGTALTGIWTASALRRILAQLPPGISELMSHPGEYDQELSRQSTRLLESREQESNLLTSPAVEQLLQRHHVALQHYGEHLS
jgi:chitin disaccharide deacetylase